MTALEERAALEAYSRGEIIRRELSQRLGKEITPSEVIVLLAKNDLPLPQVRSPIDAEGPRLLRELLAAK